MANILCIYSATDLCSVALCSDGVVICKRNSTIARSHTEKITILIRECMETAGISYDKLDAVAVSAGPGSYTSLRIGASTAKGIAYACDCSLLAIPTLDIIAAAVVDKVNEGVIVSMLDARRMEAYCATYSASGVRLSIDQPTILDGHFLATQDGPVTLCGNGAPKSVSVLQPHVNYHLDITEADAGDMAILSLTAYKETSIVDTALWQPDYIKPVNIVKRKKPLL